MEEKEVNNIYVIPANYTDSGRLLGGMLETRNTIEAIIMVSSLGYAEFSWLPVRPIVLITVMTVTIIPLAVIALMGVGGNSLGQYLCHIIRFALKRRKLHYRRIGYSYAPEQKKNRERRKKEKSK